MLMVQLQGKQSRVRASILGPKVLRVHRRADRVRPTRKGGGYQAQRLFLRPARRRRKQSQLLGVRRIDLLLWAKDVVEVLADDRSDWPITRRACTETELARGRNSKASESCIPSSHPIILWRGIQQSLDSSPGSSLSRRYWLITTASKSQGAARWSTMRPEAPRLSHPYLTHLIGPRFPKSPAKADHWDAAATTCLYLDTTRPTAYGH